MSDGYSSTISDGREIYIPDWSVKVQYENLTQACKYLGQENVITISGLNKAAAVLALMNADSPKETTALVLHFVQQVRIDGSKIGPESMDELGASVVLELFTHVIHSQYNDFFESGLAKAPSQDK